MRLFRKVSAQQITEMARKGHLPDGALVPAYKKDWEWFIKKKPTALLVVEDHTPPSAKLRAFYWDFLQEIVDNHPVLYDTKQLNKIIKRDLKYFDIDYDLNGDPVIELRSNKDIERNFDEFKQFCDRAFDWIVVNIMPMAKGKLLREIENRLQMSLKDALKGNKGQDEGEVWGDDDEISYKGKSDRDIEREQRAGARRLAQEAASDAEGEA